MLRGPDADGGGTAKDVIGGTSWTENGTDIDTADHPRIIYPSMPHINFGTAAAPPAGDPEGMLIGGKLVGGGLLSGRLVG